MFGSKNIIKDLPKSLLEAVKEVQSKEVKESVTAPSVPVDAAKRQAERDIMESWTMSADTRRLKHNVKKDGTIVESFKTREDAKNYIAKMVSEEIESLEEMYIVYEGNEDLLEDAGNLKDYPNHVKKAIVQLGGGKDSNVNNLGRVKSHAALKSTLTKAVGEGGVVSVHHDGKHLASIHPTDTYGRPKYGVTDNEGAKTQAHTYQVSPARHRYGKYEPARYHTSSVPHHSKGDAIRRVIDDVLTKHFGEVNKDTFKTNNIEVRTIGADKNRLALQGERQVRKPAMQTNYKTGESKPTGPYGGRDPQSKTPAGSMEKITNKAIDKLADKKVVDQDGPQSKALELHAKLHDAIKSGDTKAARSHMYELDNHIRNKGLSGESYDKESYKSALKDLKKGWGYASDRIKRMRADGKLKEGTEFEHEEFGLGTILESTDAYVEIMFEHGIEKITDFKN